MTISDENNIIEISGYSSFKSLFKSLAAYFLQASIKTLLHPVHSHNP